MAFGEWVRSMLRSVGPSAGPWLDWLGTLIATAAAYAAFGPLGLLVGPLVGLAITAMSAREAYVAGHVGVLPLVSGAIPFGPLVAFESGLGLLLVRSLTADGSTSPIVSLGIPAAFVGVALTSLLVQPTLFATGGVLSLLGAVGMYAAHRYERATQSSVRGEVG